MRKLTILGYVMILGYMGISWAGDDPNRSVVVNPARETNQELSAAYLKQPWGHGGMAPDYRPVPPWGFSYHYGAGLVSPYGGRPIGYCYPGWVIKCPGCVGLVETRAQLQQVCHRRIPRRG